MDFVARVNGKERRLFKELWAADATDAEQQFWHLPRPRGLWLQCSRNDFKIVEIRVIAWEDSDWARHEPSEEDIARDESERESPLTWEEFRRHCLVEQEKAREKGQTVDLYRVDAVAHVNSIERRFSEGFLATDAASAEQRFWSRVTGPESGRRYTRDIVKILAIRMIPIEYAKWNEEEE